MLRISALSVRQAFGARSYLFRSRRVRPADDGLHVLLPWRIVACITQVSTFPFCMQTSLALVCGSSGGGIIGG
jgi:hypothetical protein